MLSYTHIETETHRHPTYILLFPGQIKKGEIIRSPILDPKRLQKNVWNFLQKNSEYIKVLVSLHRSSLDTLKTVLHSLLALDKEQCPIILSPTFIYFMNLFRKSPSHVSFQFHFHLICFCLFTSSTDFLHA